MISDVISAVSIACQKARIVQYYSVRDLGAEFKFFSFDTRWATLGDSVTVVIGEDEFYYSITEVICNKSVTVAHQPGDTVPASGTFLLPALTFKYGTVRRVNAELVQLCNELEYFPNLVYLVEVMTSEQPQKPGSLFSDNGEVRLFCLKGVDNIDNLTSPEFYAAGINKTEKIAKALLMEFKRSPLVGKLTSSRTWNHINAGKYSDKGAESNLFNFSFSGTEVRLTLPVIKQCC